MPIRTTGVLPIPSLVVFALACGCGGHFEGHDAGGGSAPDSGVLVGTSNPSSTPAASGPGGMSGPPISGPSGGLVPPLGSSVPPGSAPETDASCTPSVLPSARPGTLFDACWTCMTRGCMPQLATCIADCACNAMLGEVLSAMNRGGRVTGCMGPSSGPGPWGATAFCLAQACLDCGCSDATVADGGNCTPMGGSATSGPDGCSSTFSETCNGTNYEITCTCPDAKCACFGPTSQVIAYSACPYCPVASVPTGWSIPSVNDLFAQCGFP
jgi:hypothetical protein